MDHTEDGTRVRSQRISFTHETSSRGSKEDVTVAVSERILRSPGTSPGGGVLRPPVNDFPELPSSMSIGSIPIVSHQIETRKLQVPPTPNPEGVLQHDVRCTDTITDTAPVAYQSATTLSTPMHPMTTVK